MKKAAIIHHVPAVAVPLLTFLFWYLCYPYHLHFQEQEQLFEFSSTYASDILFLPGGVADYLGRFLTQFFYLHWMGALILGLLMLWAYQLCRALSTHAWLALLLVALLFAQLCDEQVLLGVAIGFCLSLQTFELLFGRARGWGLALGFLLMPSVLYLLCGPVAFVTLPLGLVGMEDKREDASFPLSRRAVVGLLSLLLLGFTVGLSMHSLPCPKGAFLTGIHYMRSPELTCDAVAWACVLLLLFRLMPRLGLEQRESWRVVNLSLKVVTALALPAILYPALNWKAETSFAYDYMVRHHEWNRILDLANAKAPSNAIEQAALHLALAETNRLSSHLFDYPQHGTEGLFPSYQQDPFTPLFAAEAFYQLGFINTAQQYTFEAKESITDFQKSARCYQRLAETNLINGDYAVARKYLDVLSRTLFYADWARERTALLGDEERINRHPEYGRMRQLRHKEDFFFSSQEMESMLGKQIVAYPTFRLAFDYLMAHALLERNLDHIVSYIQLSQSLGYTHLPKVYEEALLLAWTKTHTPKDQLPPYLTQQMAVRIDEFYRLAQANNRDRLAERFGKTYWYYYFYEK